MTDLPIMLFESEMAWEHWLEENHARSDGFWMKIAKKGADTTTVNYAEALTVALCFGWIDGQKNKFDEAYWLQKFTPRRPKSKWSQVNCDKVTELIAQGRMRASGLAEVEKAQQDGRWDDAYPPQSKATIPEDLQQALDENPQAQASFDTLKSQDRYAILYRLHNTKKPETRQKRIAELIAMLASDQNIYD
jgi:uncharacterized protein YdeI (YjbR/CyaY-like superfamily)